MIAAGRFYRNLLCLSVLAAYFVTRSLCAAADPTFLIFKYQHIVGDEVDDCTGAETFLHCHARFQLRFTGSSISLDADLQTGPAFRVVTYSAHGGNSTRSFVDLDIRIQGKQADVRRNGVSRTAPLPDLFFTLEQDAPFLTQEALFRYWQATGKPARIALLPEGEARIRQRGTLAIAPTAESLTRYSIHGVTWGDETVWLNPRGEIAAVVGSDAEEDRIEVVRPRYRDRIKDFANQAAADAVADLESAARTIKPMASGTFALTHATVIDPAKTAGAPESGVTILVRGGKIAAIGKTVTIPSGVKIVDANGKFVLPGLWDTHAHFEQWEWGPAYLAAGITSVRDVGNEIEFLVPIRASLNGNRGLGPHMRAAGLIDSDPGSLTSEHAEDEERARAIVDRYHHLGYEQIKIYQSLQPGLIPIVAGEAHRLGMTVTGHVPTGVDALTAIKNGMDQINHINFITRVMREPGAAGFEAGSNQARAVIRALLEHHTVVEPTLARGEYNGHPRRRPFGDYEPSMPWLPPPLASILNNSGVSQDREERAAASLATALAVTKALFEAGVPILAGSDQVVPGFSIHRELELLVRAGLTPLEAIRTATTIPASVFGCSDLGLDVGKRADLVVLDANPLQDIRNIRRVYLTIQEGSAYQPRQVATTADLHF